MMIFYVIQIDSPTTKLNVLTIFNQEPVDLTLNVKMF